MTAIISQDEVIDLLLMFLALTLNGIKLALKELAAFHATGYHFINAFPGGKEALAKLYRDLFQTNFFEGRKIGDEKVVKIFAPTFDTSIDIVRKFGSVELAERMVSYRRVLKSEMLRVYRSKSDINFLIHGDAWFSNFMFK